MLTVVAKLFGLVRPDIAIFGQKDYQQLVLIRQLVADLCISGSHGALEIVGAPTDREDDGLARSSRNRYLDAEQRRQAAALNRVLHAAGREAPYGVEAALDAARAELRVADGVDLDYFEIRTPDLAELPQRGRARHPRPGAHRRSGRDHPADRQPGPHLRGPPPSRREGGN